MALHLYITPVKLFYSPNCCCSWKHTIFFNTFVCSSVIPAICWNIRDLTQTIFMLCLHQPCSVNHNVCDVSCNLLNINSENRMFIWLKKCFNVEEVLEGLCLFSPKKITTGNRSVPDPLLYLSQV